MAGNRRPPALVYGRNPVREALRAGRNVKRLLVATASRPEARLEEIIETARVRGIDVETVERRHLDDVAHTQAHQGVVAYLERRGYAPLDEILAGAGAEVAPILLVLDGIQDPQNLGSICRTAEAAGVAGVILPRHRSAEVTPAVAKASAGAVEHLRIAQVASVAQVVDRLRAEGYWTVGLAVEGAADYDQVRLDGKLAIVVGAEGAGLHRLVRERCDQLARLPMLGRVDSLNAAVAASIVLYEALRQRR